jgi:hypothetical protein
MRRHSLKGTWSNRKLLNLHGILDKWTDIATDVGRKWNKIGDVPWWYNERADLSHFAGAVWLTGGEAMEEFSDEKRKIGKTTWRLHGSYKGRVDLFFETPNGSDYYLECKSLWSGATRPNKNTVERVEEWLDWACKDVKKFHPHRGRRLGMVFVKPYIKRSPGADVKSLVSDWLWLFDDFDCDAMAWSFPLSCKCGKSSEYFCPGVVIFIKEFRK